jgi:uncharacterized SAM-binding protein YcdF (DUF218 family)
MANASKSSSFARFLRRLLGLILLAALGWTLWVVHRINQVASEDQAQPVDAIAVFGAAEYSGRPSPVYHARLDHAVSLYQRQIAPVIVTLGGGSDRDSGKTEGGVGRDYLLAEGIPFVDIIAETDSFTTSQQAQRLAEIAREHNFHHLIVVSDPTHLFRIKALCEQNGLDVYTSPRPALGHIDNYDLTMRYLHEILSYTALRLHLEDTWLHRWFDGKGDD